jgi:hypothetical protein
VSTIVIVWHAEDAVLEMLSVIERSAQIDVIVVSRRETISHFAGEPLAARLDRLAPRPATARFADGELRAWLAEVSAGDAEIWTHSPADSRPTHAKVGWLLATLCPERVRHAVGQNRFLELVPDRTATLSGADIATKIDFVNRRCAGLLAESAGARQIQTHAVAVVERFLRVDRLAADRLFGLASSAEDAAAVAVDPWDFATSDYEAERLDATVGWIGDWCRPGGHTLVEVGACEGALTTRLADKGHRIVATEPNPVFRARLTGALAGRDIPVGEESLADLTHASISAPAAVLLIEMLYYGQDLDLLNALPADMVFLATDPDQMNGQIKPWLARTPGWQVLDERALCRPRIEFVGAGRGFIRKRGSIGLLCHRSNPKENGHEIN